MKALFLTAAATIAGLTASSATASVMTVGASHAESCYRAAEARLKTIELIRDCDFAINQEALDKHDMAGTYINRGILYLQSNNVDAANRDFDAAIAVNPREAEAWLNKGITLVNLGQSSAAVGMVERAMALNTRKPALAYYIRALAHEDLGNLRAAYSDLIKARDLAPEWSLPTKDLMRYSVRRK